MLKSSVQFRKNKRKKKGALSQRSFSSSKTKTYNKIYKTNSKFQYTVEARASHLHNSTTTFLVAPTHMAVNFLLPFLILCRTKQGQNLPFPTLTLCNHKSFSAWLKDFGGYL